MELQLPFFLINTAFHIGVIPGTWGSTTKNPTFIAIYVGQIVRYGTQKHY